MRQLHTVDCARGDGLTTMRHATAAGRPTGTVGPEQFDPYSEERPWPGWLYT